MTRELTMGGCLPTTWPRPPRPPVPEPEPDSLDEQVDWMTYSHPELYSMIHTGLDLTGAMSVSAKWARLGDELADIGDELARLMAATAQAWQGDSAELAQESVSALADWSRETGVRATEVSGCITVQVDNATAARNNMPTPPYPVGTASVPSQATAFTSGDFETARSVVADPATFTSQERALHQQAARTMETFQTNTRDVYATVPRFAPPNLRKTFVAPQPPEQPVPPQTVPQQALVAAAPQTRGPLPPTGGAPAAGPSAGGGVRAMPAPPAALAPGGGMGTAEPPPARPAAAAASSTTPGRPGASSGMSGVPMGGAPVGQGGEDTERPGKKYLEGDDDIWGLDDDKLMPPVIGEVNRRA
ncbi:PPE domain-containing protein [Actinophytocola sp.]|uniref:PPE domain-containing protein n=1 Tax=Actinophytocola sp. TaxID=1872138 RepID=UPI002ECFE6F1